MLVLRRKPAEAIRFTTEDGATILVTVLAVEGKTVKLGVKAPMTVHVVREELDTRRYPPEQFGPPKTGVVPMLQIHRAYIDAEKAITWMFDPDSEGGEPD